MELNKGKIGCMDKIPKSSLIFISKSLYFGPAFKQGQEKTTLLFLCLLFQLQLANFGSSVSQY